MSPRFHKVVRDFWQERTRSLLVVAAIALGIAAFSAVLSTYAILNRELNQGYLATNPASATIRVESVDDALLAAVAATPGVEVVEARRAVGGRLKAGPAQWRSLTLFVVKDYADIKVSTITRETGAWPPGEGEILIERDAFQVARAKIGDTVLVRLPQGEARSLRVTGGVHDVGQAQARMENTVYGYITLETLVRLGGSPFLDQLKILVSGDRFDRSHIGTVADSVRRAAEDQGHAVRGIDIPDPGRHPHADLMGMLLLAISSFGLLVLALSGILVVNLLTALMASQVRQIGMMKAIGGTRTQIAWIYYGQALLLGVVAVVVALPFGLLGGRLLCQYLSRFLNFDTTSFAVPAWVYLLVALVGLLTPLLAASYPVLKGTGVSVWSALSHFGVADQAFGAGALDRALASVGGMTRPVLFALRNSFRRRARLALTLLTLTAGGLFYMSALNVRTSMINTLDHLFASRRFDLSVNLGTMHEVERIDQAVSKAPGVTGWEGWVVTEGSVVAKGEPLAGASPAARGSTPHGSDAASEDSGHGAEERSGRRFPVIGVQAGTKLLRLEITEGRDLRPGDVNALVANTALAARPPGIKVGQSVSLRLGPTETVFLVVGLAREAFSPAVGYVPRAYFERAGGHGGMANSLRVALERGDGASIERAREALDAHLEAEGIRPLSTISSAESRFGFDQHMLMIYVFLIVMSVIIGGVGGLGLMTTMSLNVLERRREMGVLRAIGASSRVVSMIVLAEGLTIGLMSFLLASALAGPTSRGLGNFLSSVMFNSELSFSFDLRGLAVWFAASLALSALASFLPAWSAARSPVREALGFE